MKGCGKTEPSTARENTKGRTIFGKKGTGKTARELSDRLIKFHNPINMQRMERNIGNAISLVMVRFDDEYLAES